MSCLIDCAQNMSSLFGCGNCKRVCCDSKRQSTCNNKIFIAQDDIFENDSNEVSNGIIRIKREPIEGNVRMKLNYIFRYMFELNIHHIGIGN